MRKLVGTLGAYPARALFSWYFLLAAVGTILLWLPAASRPDVPQLSFSDALFTATSAACVTGLIVRDVAEFSNFGQLVLLMLMQLGGLGIMTVATLFLVHFTGRQTFRQLAVVQRTLGTGLVADLHRVLIRVVSLTLVFEVIGALCLMVSRWGQAPLGELTWWAIFHAVSAFCNAGLTLHPASLEPWAENSGVMLTVATLIVAGGLGSPVLASLGSHLGLRRPFINWHSMTFHTRLTLTTSAILLFGGALLIGMLETGNGLAGLGGWDAGVAAFFQSATTRTAGFNTIPTAELTNGTLYFLILLMFVGGGSCSTAGGIKVTTVATLVIYGVSRLKGNEEVSAFRHKIALRTVAEATVILLVGMVIIVVALGLILVLEENGSPVAASGLLFRDAMFEVVSAFGTVGLSTGLTKTLEEASRYVIVALMFVGRIGPLSLVTLLALRPRGPEIGYPQGELHIG